MRPLFQDRNNFTMTELKNTFKGFNSRVDEEEESVNSNIPNQSSKNEKK